MPAGAVRASKSGLMNVDFGERDVDVQNTRVVVRIVAVLGLRGITNSQSNRSLGIVVREEVARYSTDDQYCQDSRDSSVGQPCSTGLTGSLSRLSTGILRLPRLTSTSIECMRAG